MSPDQISQLYFEPHYIAPAGFASMMQAVDGTAILAHKPETLEPGMAGKFDWVDDFVVQRGKASIDKQGIGHAYVAGPVYTGLSEWQQKLGITDMGQVGKEIAEMKGNVRGLMLHIDSPGGSVSGTRELAEAIEGMGVPVVVHTTSMLASAAYYIAASANTIVASPSAAVGSIGVYIPWTDSSAFYQSMGLKWDPIVSSGSDLKAIGAGPSLTDEQRQFLQEDVDRSFDAFKSWVAKFRDVSPDLIRGQAVRGEQALAGNLIDMVGSEEDAYKNLISLAL